MVRLLPSCIPARIHWMAGGSACCARGATRVLRLEPLVAHGSCDSCTRGKGRPREDGGAWSGRGKSALPHSAAAVWMSESPGQAGPRLGKMAGQDGWAGSREDGWAGCSELPGQACSLGLGRLLRGHAAASPERSHAQSAVAASLARGMQGSRPSAAALHSPRSPCMCRAHGSLPKRLILARLILARLILARLILARLILARHENKPCSFRAHAMSTQRRPQQRASCGRVDWWRVVAVAWAIPWALGCLSRL